MANSGRPYKIDPKVESIRSEIRENNLASVKIILKEFGVNSFDSDGRTALINAVIENRPEFVVWLIENGADVNIQDRSGFTALHFAGQYRMVEMSNFLLDNGANPNVVDIHGNSPLWTAVFNSKRSDDDQGVVENLLKFGADPSIKNQHGRSAGELYESFHDVDILTILK